MVSVSVLTRDRWIAPTSFLLLLAAYHFVFGPYFPNGNGTLGGDYASVLPSLLDGYFWFRSNGLFEPFWFTPAFCGGQPALADPASIFYSVAQLLTFFFNPLTSVYATVLLFASLGFWGFYLLLRFCFGTSHHSAVLGGALFMFNGFFIHRMIGGHFIYHGMMLIPLISWLLLKPIPKPTSLAIVLNGAAAGSLFAYSAYSGLISLILPCAVAVLAIICVYGVVGREFSGILQRALLGALVAIGLSAAKLSALLSFLHSFPRSDYSLPGMKSAWDVISILFSSLFFAPTDIAQKAQPLLTGMRWALDRPEWEYGVSIVPLLIILTGMAVAAVRTRHFPPHLSHARWACGTLLVFVLVLPLALNIYTPEWNVFLKQLPVIKSSSNLVRWFLIYIPVVILVAALFFDITSPLVNHRNSILPASLAALILVNVAKDRDYYNSQDYRPDIMIAAFQAARSGTIQPRIRNIGAFVDINNQILLPSNRNELIAAGASQLACYNPIFGYRLEHFPIKTLHLGSVLAEKNGVLNVKNPACYLYPEQNNCTPGDHFTVEQRMAAEAFVNYKPFPFNFSLAQKTANNITYATLMFLLVLLAVALSKRLRQTRPDLFR